MADLHTGCDLDFVRPLRREVRRLERQLTAGRKIPQEKRKLVLPVLLAVEARKRRIGESTGCLKLESFVVT